MTQTTPVSLASLIDDSLSVLYRHTERPLQAIVGSDALTNTVSDKTFNVSFGAGSITPPVVVENGQELILVYSTDSAANPTFTCSRGYTGTPVQAGPSGSNLLVDPLFPRYRVKQAVLRALQRAVPANGLPALETATYTLSSQQVRTIELPENTIRVRRVSVTDSSSKDTKDVHGWSFEHDSPVSSTGRLLRVHPLTASQLAANSSVSLVITREIPYTWSGASQTDPAETDTVAIPVAALDIVPLWVAAYTVSQRELTRLELDKVEEWANDNAQRSGLSLRIVQQIWSEFYRAAEEAAKQWPVHRPIVYRGRREY